MSGSGSQQTESALLQEISESLTALATWVRVMGHLQVKQTLETVLDSYEKRLVYDAMNGTRSVAEIHELTGVNRRYISEWGQEWEGIGIVMPSRVSKVKGRRQGAFELAAFGIQIADTSGQGA